MGLLKQRRDAKATCHVCGSPDYHIRPSEFAKPNIECGQCKTVWQCGRGGIYLKLAWPEEQKAILQWQKEGMLGLEVGQ